MEDVSVEFRRESNKLMHGRAVALETLSYEIQAAVGEEGQKTKAALLLLQKGVKKVKAVWTRGP